jgi:hypothetical protein
MGRAWSKSGVQKGSSLCAETFGTEIRRPARCGFCHSGSAQGPSDQGVPLARFHLREVFNAEEQYKPRSFLSQAAVDNLLFLRNVSVKSPENLQELWSDQPSTVLYTDTSGTTGWGSVLEPSHEATRSSAGWWASQEVLEMITLKELKACRHDLHQNVEALRGRTVKLYQDNQARSSVERCAKCHPSVQHSWLRSRTSYRGSTKTRSVSTWSTFGAKKTWQMYHRANGV